MTSVPISVGKGDRSNGHCSRVSMTKVTSEGFKVFVCIVNNVGWYPEGRQSVNLQEWFWFSMSLSGLPLLSLVPHGLSCLGHIFQELPYRVVLARFFCLIVE